MSQEECQKCFESEFLVFLKLLYRIHMSKVYFCGKDIEVYVE